jgi:hypothetical protein
MGRGEEAVMTVIVALIMLALVFAGLGLLVEGLLWLLVIAGAMFIGSIALGVIGRSARG